MKIIYASGYSDRNLHKAEPGDRIHFSGGYKVKILHREVEHTDDGQTLKLFTQSIKKDGLDGAAFKTIEFKLDKHHLRKKLK